jgi:hypothetical protein
LARRPHYFQLSHRPAPTGAMVETEELYLDLYGVVAVNVP